MTKVQEVLTKSKCIILDADGTLFDVMGKYARYFGDLLEIKYDCDREMAIVSFFVSAGISVDKQFEAVLNEQGIQFRQEEIDQLVETFFEFIRSQTDANPFDDVLVFFNWLSANDKILFLSSGSPTDALVSRLKKLGLFDRFSAVMGSDVILKSEEHIKAFAKQIGVSFQDFVNNACMVGDGPHDMEIARESEIFAIGLIRGAENIDYRSGKMKKAGANHIICSLKELVSN